MKLTLLHKTIGFSLGFHLVVLFLFALFLPSKVTSFVRLAIELAALPEPPEALGRETAEPAAVAQTETVSRQVRIYLPEVLRDPVSEIVSLHAGAVALEPREDLLPGAVGASGGANLPLAGPGAAPLEMLRADAGVRLTGPGRERRPVYAPLPVYPEWARERGAEAYLEIMLWIEASGAVTRAEVHRTSGYPDLDRLCLGVVRGWRFEPGESGETWAVLPLRFHLR